MRSNLFHLHGRLCGHLSRVELRERVSGSHGSDLALIDLCLQPGGNLLWGVLLRLTRLQLRPQSRRLRFCSLGTRLLIAPVPIDFLKALAARFEGVDFDFSGLSNGLFGHWNLSFDYYLFVSHCLSPYVRPSPGGGPTRP